MESPLEVAVGYLNNLAYAQGMKRVYQYGFYVGTFGEYDLGAIRKYTLIEVRGLALSRPSTGPSPAEGDFVTLVFWLPFEASTGASPVESWH